MNRTTYVVMAVSIAAIALSSAFIWQSAVDSGDGDPMDSVIEISCTGNGSASSAGTGFAVDYQGHNYVVTNAHVVSITKGDSCSPHSSFKGRTVNSDEWFGLTLISFDTDNDLAILDYDHSVDIKGLKINTSRADYGDKVSVIGNAMGYGLSVKEGVVSVPEIDISVDGSIRECIMVSATINNGDSGSPILDEKGDVIGISSFKLKENGVSVSGMSYGILSSSLDRYLSYLFSDNSDTKCSISLITAPNCVYDANSNYFDSVYTGSNG